MGQTCHTHLALIMNDNTWYPIGKGDLATLVEISHENWKLQFCQDGDICNPGCTPETANELTDEDFISHKQLTLADFEQLLATKK